MLAEIAASRRFCPLSPAVGVVFSFEVIAGERVGVRGPPDDSPSARSSPPIVCFSCDS